jgi:hypothetical protein
MTFISMHSVSICVVFSGAYMRCTQLCSLNPGMTQILLLANVGFTFLLLVEPFLFYLLPFLVLFLVIIVII